VSSLRAERDGLRAAAGLEAHVHAVAVEVLALAGEPDERVEELLVVLDAGRELVLDHDVAGRAGHVARAARREVGLRQQLDRAVGQPRQVGGAGDSSSASRRARSASSGVAGDPRERARDRGGRLADAREDLARERARGRERRVERAKRALAARSVAGSSRIEALQVRRTREANAAIVRLKLVIRS
jgi:hypothetical protein